MKILSNNTNMINLFNSIYTEILNSNETDIAKVSKEIKSRMLNLGAKILEDWVSENVGNGYSGTKITKNIDGENISFKFHNHIERHYLSCLGEIKLKRSYYKHKDCGFYPIEEKNPWLKQEFLPDIKELSCYVSMLEPYELASEMIDKIGGISISSTSLQKITKSIGEELVKQEDSIVKKDNINFEKNKPDLLVVSSDGACINTKEDWKEVKSGAVYEIETIKNKDGEDVIKAKNKSYVSRIENSHDFGKRLYIEARRRNVSFANKVVMIGDGARWIWEMSGKYYPNAIEVVDWYHATEHLWSIIELMYGNRNSAEGQIFEEKCEEYLYSGFIMLLKAEIEEKAKELNIKKTTKRYKSISTEINYFLKNEKRMKYEYFESQQYPIGSGVIEGACKHLVQMRMKRNGMKWSISGAHDVLQLRCLYLSNRWDEVIEEINNVAA